MSKPCACIGPCSDCGVCKCQCQCPKPPLASHEFMVYRKSLVRQDSIIPDAEALFWEESDARAWIGKQPTKVRYDLEVMPAIVVDIPLAERFANSQPMTKAMWGWRDDLIPDTD